MSIVATLPRRASQVFPPPTIRRASRPRRRGAALVLVLLLLVAFFATAALSVDVAYMHLINVELRASTDAAAAAAVETLGQAQDVNAARQAAKAVAAANPVGGAPLILADEDIVFGRGLFKTNGSVDFQPVTNKPNAARVTGRRERGSPSGPTQLFFGGVVGMPRWDTRQLATAARWDRDICLVVDRSGSMNYDEKLDDLREAVDIFVEILEEDPFSDNVGLASYNHIPRVDRNLTSRLDEISEAMGRIRADGQTNIGGGISTGRAMLTGFYSRSNADRTMIVLSDGLHNVGYDPLLAANQAKAFGIVIHTVTFGPDADQVLMREVARMTGGVSYHAPDGKSLKEIYRTIALSFGTILTE